MNILLVCNGSGPRNLKTLVHLVYCLRFSWLYIKYTESGMCCVFVSKQERICVKQSDECACVGAGGGGLTHDI